MMANAQDYVRLPGRARKGFGLLNATSQRLWWKPDHLLVVSSLYFTERYKRFYFEDIQAVTITRTSSGRVMNIVLTVLAALFGLWAFLSYTNFGWDIVATMLLAMMVAIWLLLAGLNALLGPTCRCLLYTAVHCDELFCLGRLRTAQGVLQTLHGYIEAAQGGPLTGEALETVAARQESGETLSAPPASPARETRVGLRPARHEPGTVHATLFYLLFVDAVMSGIHLVAPGVIPDPIVLVFIMTLIGFTIWALVRQKDSTLPQRLRSVTWATFGYLCVIVASIYVFWVINDFGQAMSDEPPESLVAVRTTLSQIVNSLSILFDLLLGGIGMQYLNEFRRRAQPEPAASPEVSTESTGQE